MHSQWSTLRSFRQSGEPQKKLTPGTFRRILGFGHSYRRDLVVFLGLVVVSAVLGVVTPLLFKTLIDEGVVPGRRDVVVEVALAVVGIAVLDAILSLAQRWFSSRVGEGLIYDLRTEVYAHVSRMPLAFFTRTQTGSLVSRLNGDVVGAQRAFTSTLSGVVSNAISLVLVTGTMIVLSWQITLAALLLLPVFLLPARWVGRKLADINREAMQLNADMSQTMTERFHVAGAMLVKIFGHQSVEQSAFAARAARVRDIGVTNAMYSRVFFTSLTLIAALATAVVYGVGGWLAADGALQVGTLVALAALLSRLYGPLTALSNVHVDVMTALVSFERVFEVLDLEPMVADRPGAVPLSHDARTVEFDAVSFAYPSATEVSLASLEAGQSFAPSEPVPVLTEVSFRAEPGQLVALVGPSGAGKTTITALVARLYDVTGGSVRVGGHDVREVTQDSLHEAIGVVSQDAHLFHDTIRANLRYAAPEATDEQLLAACEAAQIRAMVDALPDGLDTVVGDRGYRLSGGEKQRLAIARVLLKAPRIVILDEATAHLDSESEVAVQRALDAALSGRTSLVVAHRLSTIQEADLILVVADGRIVERGAHAELLGAGGLYSELYRTQFARGQGM